MHRGTVFVITKDEKNEFLVQKSTEFNGGMGLDCYGKTIYEMLKDFQEPPFFDEMIRNFDDRFFKYGDDVMTYVADEQQHPYISKNGYKEFSYSRSKNQFKFFKDDNGDYIYTSDSNYIKNLSNEDIQIVCGNGVYILKPNQIMITDYDECVNNIGYSFDIKFDKKLGIEKLDIGEYIISKKQENILKLIVETLESFGYNTTIGNENGADCYIDIEKWTNGGVDMIQTIDCREDFSDLYNINKIAYKLKELAKQFDIDEEIDLYRENENYKNNFTIKESLNDFEQYKNDLEDLSNNFIDRYQKIIYEKFLKKEFEMEEINL